MVFFAKLLTLTILGCSLASAALAPRGVTPIPTEDLQWLGGPDDPQPWNSTDGADPGVGATAACTRTKLRRRAWHALSTAEKKAYIDAVRCLQSRPKRTNHPTARSLFDDFQGTHQRQASWIHGCGYFLPFHRYMLWAYERLLRTECGYRGAQPYWEETRDAGRFSRSVIFDPVTGFGGDGGPSGPCVTDGPFARYTLSVGPSYRNTRHCLDRNFNDFLSFGAQQANINNCMTYTRFRDAWPCLEDAPHIAGHNAVGGEMSNPISSPGDPLFYMHHAQIDRLFYYWQKRDLSRRLTDIAGYTTSTRPANGQWVPVTLDDVMVLDGIVGSIRVRDVMDASNDRMCYEYA